METIFERVAGLDVHKAQVTACVRVPGPRGEREEHLAEFPTTVRGLMGLRDWRRPTGSPTWPWRPPACTGSPSGKCWTRPMGFAISGAGL